MYFKIKNKILFRRYEEYGYLTDNSMFGYRFLNDNTPVLEEKYVSESAAVMLDVLSKTPKHIDEIIESLLTIFIGVEFDELKQDTLEFFMQLSEEGFLSFGETYEDCINNEILITDKSECDSSDDMLVENCSKNVVKQNDFLRSIHIEVASECNERCVHCYIPHECKDSTINSELFFKILHEGRDLNIIHVTLSGGEPLLHKDFLSFLKKCRELDLAVNVLTNLTLLNDEILNEMKLNPLLSVQTSLYSMVPEVHDAITKVKGSFKKTKEAVLKLIDAGIPVQISCPIMKQNKDSFNEVIEWGKSHNISVLVDYVIFAAYDQSNSNLVNRLTVDEVTETFEKQLSQTYVDSLCEIAEEKYALTGTDPICSICRYYFCVAANGDVFPCIGWQSNVVGNLNTSSIKEIWEESKEINNLRCIKRDSFPKCITCENRGFCTVCMMSNDNESGNKFEISDFHCQVAAMMHSKVREFKNANK